MVTCIIYGYTVYFTKNGVFGKDKIDFSKKRCFGKRRKRLYQKIVVLEKTKVTLSISGVFRKEDAK